MQWRLAGLVERRSQAVDAFERRLGGRVPGHPEAINIEEPVPNSDFVLGSNVVRAVGEELGKVVVVDLLGEGVGLGMSVVEWGVRNGGRTGVMRTSSRRHSS